MDHLEIIADDYSTRRVPPSARRSWFGIAVQRFGQVSDLSQFLLGAMLGFGMTFWNAFWALTLGAIVFEVLAILTGIIGAHEGLNTSLLARWSGFGRIGSALLAVAISISLIGWFGIQTGISAVGLHQLMPALSTPAWAIIFGFFITLIVVRGFESMQWVANVTVPLFLVLVGWAVVSELSQHSLTRLMQQAPPGPEMSLVSGATVVAGSFVVGSVIAPDMTRYNRSVSDVVKQTLIGITLGEYAIGMVGVLLAHAVKSNDITAIIFTSVGWVGVLVIVLGTAKINDWNLYSSSLGFVNIADLLFGIRLHRGLVTVAVGTVGTMLAATGFLDRFVDFLTILSVAFPPVAGIMVAEYFVVKRWRPALEHSRSKGTLPDETPNWVPATLVIWLGSALIGYHVTIGMPALNSVTIAFVLYLLAGRLGLLVSIGATSAPDLAETNR
ncbi:purine-cytosine permease family protein [Streptomyces capillispiralis]|uniref:Cytosine permease n=1 Tax=Streptomyces capillispiralis TaxID=68182 RepID=A0A561SGN2_9ACTN|nr:cytosine permease [Streptomyces capillispiralis]TWF73993.1 cytosine permease [Streptomyces capillispiralis]GHH96317.1 cytosine permease [Streptomyces capillispiralis]